MNDRELAALVRQYERQFIRKCQDRKAWYISAPDLRTAIIRAAESIDENGLCEPHQRRVGRIRLRRFAKALAAKQSKIKQCSSFDQLHSVVGSVRMERIGALTVYDVSERIGAFMRLRPETVYLHAGAAEGAKSLGVRGSGGKISIDALPRPLRSLSAHDIENFLCIFKDELSGIAPTLKSKKANGCRTKRGKPIC